MGKVDLATADIAAENAAKLAELFPDIVTEVLDEDGNVRHSIDVEALKAHVGDIAEDKRERYQFTWPGKQRARAEAIRPISKTMRPCPEESVNWDTTENLYIEGDNLDALKILRETYAGKIKMIYIDPPYNTGHDFVYNDSFARTAEEERAESGAFDEEGNVLDAVYNENKESNGRFHSDWCSMMYPRLVLARDLLSDDGSIFVSIDCNETDALRRMMSEIFGEGNFQREIIWRIGWLSGYKTMANNFIRNHDSILFYSKSSDCMDFIKLYIQNKDFKPLVKKTPALTSKLESFGIGKSKHEQLLRFINHENRPEKYPLEDTWNCNEYDDLNSIAIVSFSGEKISKQLGIAQDFTGQKSIAMLKRCIESTVRQDDLVLDFFSGTGSTAHAVMQLNAEDGGNRKFIMVQLPEVCDEKSEAAKAGYRNICEIGKERIRRAGAKIAAEVEESNAQLKLGEEPKKVPDIGFRVLKIDSSNFEDVKRTPDAIQQDQLSGLADNLKTDRTPEDILFQLFPQFQIPYTASVEKLDICGKAVYSVDGDALLACFDREVSEDVIRAMAEREPSRAVLRDASFVGDDALANFEEIFKTLSPETETKVV